MISTLFSPCPLDISHLREYGYNMDMIWIWVWVWIWIHGFESNEKSKAHPDFEDILVGYLQDSGMNIGKMMTKSIWEKINQLKNFQSPKALSCIKKFRLMSID